MTYGEYYYLLKYDMKLKDGVWVTSKPKITIPHKMSRKDADIYYASKFNEYWKSEKLESSKKK